MFFRANTLVRKFIKFQLQLRLKYLNDIVSICMAQLCGTSFLVELLPGNSVRHLLNQYFIVHQKPS